MSTIYLVRHAQSTGNVEKRLTGRVDYPLTKEGQKQAEMLKDYLKDIKFEAVYSSPYKRAIDTVKPIATMNNIEVILKNELSEMYFGIYDGYKWENVNKINPKIDEDHQKTNEIIGIPNQETSKQVAQRMYGEISKIVTQNKNKTILIASHGVAIETFLREITKDPFIEKKEEYSQKNTCINIIQYDESNKEYKVVVLNSIEHLK